MNVLEQIQHQINLACSNDNENEARNAAIKACKLIRKHNLVISEPLRETEPAPRARTPRSSTPTPRVDAIGSFIKDVAVETARRTTVKDVVDFAMAAAKRGR